MVVNKKSYGPFTSIEDLIKGLGSKTKGWPVLLDKPVHVKQASSAKAPSSNGSGHPPASYMMGEATTREHAEEIVGTDDGNFIVREKGSDVSILCVVYKGKPTHHQLKIIDGFMTINKKPFGGATTVEEIINFLSTKQKGWPVALTVCA